ncbi:MAG: hypothetical protein K2L05_08275 [Muribaculaceae bacterium]|nr:hypothetical protein [Muribaculaceae bacterium]
MKKKIINGVFSTEEERSNRELFLEEFQKNSNLSTDELIERLGANRQ